MTSDRIRQLIEQLTLEEKAGLCSGADFWHTKPVERLGIPSVMVTDGPHGLRKQNEGDDHMGIHDSVEAVCFPTGSALASSFDRALMKDIGTSLGNACQAENVGVLLGPAVNIKRSPLCGRNFEYYSEDPLLAGEMAAAFIEGVQEQGVGTSIKHFLANNQETRRMSVSVETDERTLREIYMPAFEIAVKKAKPWTVMCSYNKISGKYVAESHKYLTDVLRGEWGFDGFVMSDWGAVNDRVPDLEAGLELEMPFSGGMRDNEIVNAVKMGALDETVLNTAVERVLKIVFSAYERKREAVFDKQADHALARRAAIESAVLLKNDSILPLDTHKKIAFIGQYAAEPHYQGGGSSHINSAFITSALSCAPAGVVYTQGYDDRDKVSNDRLLTEAMEAAQNADIAVVFAGLSDELESESFDRLHMRLPEYQNKLIENISEVQPNTVVVLHNGAPVEMPWISQVKGLLEMHLGGDAVGGAAVDLLYGQVNPSGRLSESFPIKLEDNPSHLNFPGEGDSVSYSEGIFIGYRYYGKKKMDVLFPFGFGLSYTTFSYNNLQLNLPSILDTDLLTVSVDVTNTGNVFGREVVQLYVSDREASVIRPIKELKGFDKVALLPGETKTVTFTLDKRAFAYYNTELSDWYVESGEFEILIARSSADIVLTQTVYVWSIAKIPRRYTLDSIFLDIKKDEKAMALVQPLMDRSTLIPEQNDEETDGLEKNIMTSMMEFMPLRSLVSFGDDVTLDEICRVVDAMNQL